MRTRTLVIIGVALIASGAAFATLPKEWIEETIGVEPDGGNGTLELLLALGTIVVGALVLALVYLRGQGRRPVAAGDDVG